MKKLDSIICVMIILGAMFVIYGYTNKNEIYIEEFENFTTFEESKKNDKQEKKNDKKFCLPGMNLNCSRIGMYCSLVN